MVNSQEFDFKKIDEDEISKFVNKFNVKKSTGVDNISAKHLKFGAPVLSSNISILVNQ